MFGLKVNAKALRVYSASDMICNRYGKPGLESASRKEVVDGLI